MAANRQGAGTERPIRALEHAQHVHGHDGLGGISAPEPANVDIVRYDQLYADLIQEYEAELAVVAIGPLTNLAAMLASKPDLMRRVGKIVIMGGAVWKPGNVTPHAEFNFYRDPVAAAEVLSSGLPVTIVPLDVTSRCRWMNRTRLIWPAAPAGAMTSWPNSSALV